MKQFLALLLAMMMVLSLAACGGDEPENSAPVSEDGPTTEQTQAVTDEALIPVANAVNEVYEIAEANGWLEDEQTATELQAVMGTLTFTQSALTDDPSKLENVTDFDALAESILQLAPALEEIAERVSVPYEG